MQNLPINVVDLSVLGILLLSAIFAFARGFVREVLSVIGWVGAGLVSLHGAPELLPYTHRYVSSGFLADAGTYVAVFILALLLFSILSHMISVRVRDSALGAVDRSLGFVYGLARGAVIICVAWLLMQWLLPRDLPSWVQEARVLPMVQWGSEKLLHLLPAEARARTERTAESAGAATRRAVDDAKTLRSLTAPGRNSPDSGAAANGKPDSGPETGYKDQQRQDLNGLILRQQSQ